MIKRKKRYNHKEYQSGVLVQDVAVPTRTQNVLVADLTEQEAKDELCYAHDMLQYLQSEIDFLNQDIENYFGTEVMRKIT